MKARKPAPPVTAPSPDDSSLPRGERAYRYLRAAIQSGGLKPGDRLREGELALQIGLSRTPIREALAKLEADGLVVHDASRGIMVAELDYRMVTELYYMREVLEGTAARLAAQHASEVEISILEDLCRQYGESRDNEALLEQSNRHFHDTLYRCSHNRYLINMVNGLHDALSLLGRTTLSKPERAEETLREHKAIVEAITRRDADAAELALRNHIRASQKVRMTQLFAGGKT